MTLSGRNGSGKTTLLRTISGEVGLDGGTISTGKGVRVALHDQRPPRADSTLREYVTGGLDWIAAIEAELAGSRRGWPTAKPARRRSSAYADAQARLEHAGGYRWRDGIEVALRGLGFDDEELDRPLASFSGRGADPRLAGPGAGVEARPAAARRAHQPPRHRVARMAGGLSRRASTPPSSSSPTTAGSWRRSAPRCSSSRPGAARYFKGPWHAWRAEQAARELAAGRDTARREAEIARMERFVERFRYKATKARQAQSKLKGDRADQARRPGAGPARPAHALVLVRLRRALGPGGDRARRGDARRRRSHPDRRRRRSGSSAASTSAWSAPTAPARRPWSRPWPANASLAAASCAAATTSPSATSPSTRRSAAGARRRCSPTPSTRPASRRRRRGRCSAASCSRATTCRSGSPTSPAARRSDWRSPC